MRGAALLLVMATGLAGCGKAPPPPPEPNPPTIQAPPPHGDTSVPVASGNTPAAADIAAAAALNAGFDPARDPARDLETAKVEAQRGNKRIVLEIGAQDCMPCGALDALIAGDTEIRQFRDANYVWMKVNATVQNPNAAFLAAFPPVPSPPHLLVLAADGTLLASQPGTALQDGADFDRDKLLEWLKAWTVGTAPP